MRDYSEQMIVDCNPWRYDCNGGVTSYIINNWMGPEAVSNILEQDYPYTATFNATSPAA